VWIKCPILVPFNRGAVPGRLHVELTGIETNRSPQIPRHLYNLRMLGGVRVLRIMQMRRLDAPYAWLSEECDSSRS
jgi:hypothetical protein